jgi:hypothetical protein
MKTVAEVIGFALEPWRSACRNVLHKRIGRPPLPDAELAAQIKAVIAELPTYGYRRVHAILKRQALGRRLKTAPRPPGSSHRQPTPQPPVHADHRIDIYWARRRRRSPPAGNFAASIRRNAGSHVGSCQLRKPIKSASLQTPFAGAPCRETDPHPAGSRSSSSRDVVLRSREGPFRGGPPSLCLRSS